MGIKVRLKREDNAIRADLEAAYLRILDVEVQAQTGNVRIPFYVYADQDARNAKFEKVLGNRALSAAALPVKQGTEIVTAAEFAEVFLHELDKIRSAPGELKPEEMIREAYFRTGYYFLKCRGFSGVDA